MQRPAVRASIVLMVPKRSSASSRCMGLRKHCAAAEDELPATRLTFEQPEEHLGAGAELLIRTEVDRIGRLRDLGVVLLTRSTHHCQVGALARLEVRIDDRTRHSAGSCDVLHRDAGVAKLREERLGHVQQSFEPHRSRVALANRLIRGAGGHGAKLQSVASSGRTRRSASSANGRWGFAEREPGESLGVEQSVELFGVDQAGCQHQFPDHPLPRQRGLGDVRRGGVPEVRSECGDDADTSCASRPAGARG